MVKAVQAEESISEYFDGLLKNRVQAEVSTVDQDVCIMGLRFVPEKQQAHAGVSSVILQRLVGVAAAAGRQAAVV
jgi:hypothetical protein